VTAWAPHCDANGLPLYRIEPVCSKTVAEQGRVSIDSAPMNGRSALAGPTASHARTPDVQPLRMADPTGRRSARAELRPCNDRNSTTPRLGCT
jgi:hypothetical protein